MPLKMLLLLASLPLAHADDIAVDITSDNAYGFGFGSREEMLNYFGGVQNLTAGQIFNCSGGPESYVVPDADTNGHLYVVTWSDSNVTQGLLARFQIQGYQPVYSGMSGWEVYATGLDYGNGSGGPDLATINEQILIANAGLGEAGSSGGWVGRPALVFGENNVDGQAGSCTDAFPKTCQTVMGPSARWMWHNRDPANLCAFRDGNHQEFLIFRLPVAELIRSTSCTRPAAYWASHDWPIERQQTFCGVTYDSLIAGTGTPGPWMDLAEAWMVGELNRIDGRVQVEMDEWLSEAVVMLSSCDLQLTDQTVRAAELRQLIDDYNLGVTGPGACEDGVPDPTGDTGLPTPPPPTEPTDTGSQPTDAPDATGDAPASGSCGCASTPRRHRSSFLRR